MIDDGSFMGSLMSVSTGVPESEGSQINAPVSGNTEEYAGEDENDENQEDEEEVLVDKFDETTFIDQQIEHHIKRYVRRRSSDLQVLRIRFQGDSYIPPTITDEQLIIYLFAMHYNIHRTVSLLKSNYKLRTKIPSYFTARSVTDTAIQDVWNVLKIGVFPKITEDHEHIVFLGLRNNDPKYFKAHSALKLMFMCMDVYYILEGIPCGVIVVADAEGASAGYLTSDNYTHLKIFVKYIQESMPYNVARVHVINSNFTVRSIYKAIKPFLTKDIINMIQFHKDSDMTKFLPARCLPAELGGTAPGSIDEYQENFRRRFEYMQDFFDLEEEQRTQHYIH